MISTTHTIESRRPNSVIPLVRDLLALLVLGGLLLSIHEGATPFFRGFNCDDESIRYPFRESTVSSLVCYLLGTFLNIILALCLEYQDASSSSVEGGQFKTRQYFNSVSCRLIIFIFGAISSELITDISKFTAGRLRPHFISICDPQIVGPSGEVIKFDNYCRQEEHRYEYIMDYRCNGDPSKQRDARLSFMSGHSSYSSYSATFAVLYMQSAIDPAKMGLIKPSLQVLIISGAFYIGLTRVSDYKHHWQDVFAGLSQGFLMAIVVTTFLWPAFKKTYERYLTITAPRVGGDQSGDELNPISY